MILITGAAGTVGSRLIQHFIEKRETVRAIDNDLSACERLSEHLDGEKSIQVICGDVCNPKMERYFDGVDTVIHLAASKDLVTCERGVAEAIRTNVYGVQNVLEMSAKHSISTLVFSSSDKAANPASILGMTKLLGEKLVSEYALRDGKKYYSLRFGNILGSSGSIIPLVIEKLKNHQPITITDTRMTRFVMSIEDAVRMIVETSDMASGGEVFIKKMPSVQIVDLIYFVVEKYKSEDEVEYEIIGSREAEKLHEDLISTEEYGLLQELPEYWILTGGPRSDSQQWRSCHDFSSEKKSKLDKQQVRELVESIIPHSSLNLM